MGIEDLLNCALMFLFFISMKLKAFCVTQNETPIMVETSASANKLSQNISEHVNPKSATHKYHQNISPNDVIFVLNRQ